MKGLFIGDGVVPTGFGTVIHNIIENLPEDWDITQLAINYYGDPHEYKHKIYPAMKGGDMWGFGRLHEFSDKEFDFIFILNDIWVISWYLELIKKHFDKDNLPMIVVYYPVDGKSFDADWFKHFDIVSQAVVYTEFGKRVSQVVAPTIDFEIIPHGTDLNTFYPLGEKLEARKELFPNNPELLDAFIVLNTNRNQPRKRIDVCLKGFAEFAKDKPDNVRYYHHAGIKDAGWDIFKLARIIEKEMGVSLEQRIILTNVESGVQKVSREQLNQIYNVADVGINCSTGEGWGLCNSEGAATGLPQVVPNHSACSELYEDVGILLPINQELTSPEHNITGGLVHPSDLASALSTLYEDAELREVLGKEAYKKFTSKEYTWEVIAKQWETIFRRCQ